MKGNLNLFKNPKFKQNQRRYIFFIETFVLHLRTSKWIFSFDYQFIWIFVSGPAGANYIMGLNGLRVRVRAFLNFFREPFNRPLQFFFKWKVIWTSLRISSLRTIKVWFLIYGDLCFIDKDAEFFFFTLYCECIWTFSENLSTVHSNFYFKWKVIWTSLTISSLRTIKVRLFDLWRLVYHW